MNNLLEFNQVTSKYLMDVLDNTCKKRSKTGEKEHHHQILQVQISSKFQLQQAILIF